MTLDLLATIVFGSLQLVIGSVSLVIELVAVRQRRGILYGIVRPGKERVFLEDLDRSLLADQGMDGEKVQLQRI